MVDRFQIKRIYSKNKIKSASFSQNRLYKVLENASLSLICFMAKIILIIFYLSFLKTDTLALRAIDKYRRKNVFLYSHYNEDVDEESFEEELKRQCDESDVTGMIPECYMGDSEVRVSREFQSICLFNKKYVLESNVQTRVEIQMSLCSKWRIIHFSTTNYHDPD